MIPNLRLCPNDPAVPSGPTVTTKGGGVHHTFVCICFLSGRMRMFIFRATQGTCGKKGGWGNPFCLCLCSLYSVGLPLIPLFLVLVGKLFLTWLSSLLWLPTLLQVVVLLCVCCSCASFGRLSCQTRCTFMFRPTFLGFPMCPLIKCWGKWYNTQKCTKNGFLRFRVCTPSSLSLLFFTFLPKNASHFMFTFI